MKDRIQEQQKNKLTRDLMNEIKSISKYDIETEKKKMEDIEIRN